MQVERNYKNIDFEKILDLYNSVGWTAYTKDKEGLRKAFENSDFILLCIENNEVVGVLRSLTDRVAVHLLQDILVRPSFQKQGIGRKLLTKALKEFENVRTHILLTDDEEKQRLFYESMGYKNTKDFEEFLLNCYVKI